MRARAPWSEPWQHCTSDVRVPFGGDRTQPTWQSGQDVVGRLAVEARDRDLGVRESAWSPERTDARQRV